LQVADAIVAPALRTSGIPGGAFIVFDARGQTASRFWGLADREKRTPVSGETVWPIASVTKVLTAVAALALVDRGKLDLDGDIRQPLKSVRVPDYRGPALTLRRLLSHTGGFDEVPGRQWDGRGTPPRLADFLNGGKLVRIRPAGELTAYSSYGIAIVSALIGDVSGEEYEDFVSDTVFAPLRMRAALFMRQEGDERGVAQGYAIDDGTAKRVGHEFYVTTGAASAVCTIGDMAKVGAMLLSRGAAQNARVLSTTLATEMMRQQATVHPKVPGWGLGVQLDLFGNRAVAEHGGDIGGFACLLTLVPALGLGFFTVHHGEGGDLRFRVREAVLEAIAPFTAEKPRPDPAAARRLPDYFGRYRSTLECLSCAGDGSANAFRCAPGEAPQTLSLWGQTWIPVGGDLFVRDDGVRRLGFARGADGRVTAVTGGAWRVAAKID
jgi:CubicO group peptidase (beta-lactamase class C family)